QTTPDYTIERRVDVTVRFGKLRWILLQDGADCVRRRILLESAPPGEHLVEHRAERENVGARIYWLPPQLLRRHVAHRAHNRTGVSVYLACRHVGKHAVADGFCQLGDSEVKYLHPPIIRDEQIFRFDVAMD